MAAGPNGEKAMPRRNLARRFEPRYGVSQSMLDIEAKYVGRELNDYLIHSTNELKEKLSSRQKLIETAEQELSAKFAMLPTRERIALRAMFTRDCWHMAALYLTAVDSRKFDVDTTPPRLAAEELNEDGEPRPILQFKATLFD
jgi:hypothetical protein